VRFRTLTLTIALTVLVAGIAAAPALAGDPSLPSLKQQLRHAQRSQQSARARASAAAADLSGARELFAATNASAGAQTSAAPQVATPAAMDQTLAASLLADGVVTSDEIATLQTRSTVIARVAHRWTVKVRQLRQRVHELIRITRWNQRGQWKPLIAIACKKYGVSQAGLTHMMMLESNGQRTADSGPYHGLFQFMDREWAAGWNEWRGHSIYDGWSQIQLAAKAIGRGMGPSIWPLTYRMSF
jgi:hypothetical protein